VRGWSIRGRLSCLERPAGPLPPWSREPVELPADARVAPGGLPPFHASLPSTAGVSFLAAVALVFQPTLTALLAGVLAGLGVAALGVAYGIASRLSLDPRTRAVFRR